LKSPTPALLLVPRLFQKNPQTFATHSQVRKKFRKEQGALRNGPMFRDEGGFKNLPYKGKKRPQLRITNLGETDKVLYQLGSRPWKVFGDVGTGGARVQTTTKKHKGTRQTQGKRGVFRFTLYSRKTYGTPTKRRCSEGSEGIIQGRSRYSKRGGPRRGNLERTRTGSPHRSQTGEQAPPHPQKKKKIVVRKGVEGGIPCAGQNGVPRRKPRHRVG